MFETKGMKEYSLLAIQSHYNFFRIQNTRMSDKL